MAADITPFIKDAQALEKTTGIPASITLGQIILESSGKFAGGLSNLAASAKNLFGVKGTGNAGSVFLPTTEVINGTPKVMQQSFKKYNTYYDSLVDHAKVLSLPRYQAHLKDAKTVNDFAKGIKAGGYATDPQYAEKLLGVIGSYGLSKYDSGTIKYNPIEGGTNKPFPDAPANTREEVEAGRLNTIETVYYNIVRAVVIFGLAVLMIVFFLKAFPAVDDAVQTVAPSPAKPLQMVKKMKRKAKGATTNGSSKK